MTQVVMFRLFFQLGLRILQAGEAASWRATALSQFLACPWNEEMWLTPTVGSFFLQLSSKKCYYCSCYHLFFQMGFNKKT